MFGRFVEREAGAAIEDRIDVVRLADTRRARVPEHTRRVPNGAGDYEVSRKSLRPGWSHRISATVKRSTTYIGPWQLGHFHVID